MQETLDIVKTKRQPNGCWKAEGFYWAMHGKHTSNVDKVPRFLFKRQREAG